jgi:hypothetical protein
LRRLGVLLFAAFLASAVMAAPPIGIEVQLGLSGSQEFLTAKLSETGDFSFPVQPAGRYDFKIITIDGSPISKIVGFRMVLPRNADQSPIKQSVFPATRGPQAMKDSLTFEIMSDGKTPVSGNIHPFP